mmetsp:Transcript_9019/g.15351  ORF Transcript_9019/g.15351 Transcript_9019/m.15351 type:complete len:264 (-) Transcript_9019:1737-2528(-)
MRVCNGSIFALSSALASRARNASAFHHATDSSKACTFLRRSLSAAAFRARKGPASYCAASSSTPSSSRVRRSRAAAASSVPGVAPAAAGPRACGVTGTRRRGSSAARCCSAASLASALAFWRAPPFRSPFVCRPRLPIGARSANGGCSCGSGSPQISARTQPRHDHVSWQRRAQVCPRSRCRARAAAQPPTGCARGRDFPGWSGFGVGPLTVSGARVIEGRTSVYHVSTGREPRASPCIPLQAPAQPSDSWCTAEAVRAMKPA